MAINATAVWRARPSGNNVNGGGYDAGISGAATDYSQQNAAQANGTNGATPASLGTSTTSNTIPGTTGGTFTWTTSASFGLANGTTVRAYNTGTPANYIEGTVSSNVTTSLSITCTAFGGSGAIAAWTFFVANFVDATANAFTSAMVGNCIQINSGTNFTAGFYFVTAFVSASTVTLDRIPGNQAGLTAATWHLGGGWADFWTNGTTAAGALQGLNIVYILGSGTPNPSSYVMDYTLSTNFTLTNVGGFSTGQIRFLNDPLTPGYKAAPDTTGGMPTVNVTANNGVVTTNSTWSGIWFIATSTAVSIFASGSTQVNVIGCVFDGTGTGAICYNGSSGHTYLLGCELFNGGAGGGQVTTNNSLFVVSCNFHDFGAGVAVSCTNNQTYVNNIFAFGTGGAFILSGGGAMVTAFNNTIDNMGGTAVVIGNSILDPTFFSNIISNNTGVGKFGLSVSSQTNAFSDGSKAFIDFNVYYNNTSNYQNISASPHDTALGVSPYVNSATQNYTLA